VVKVSEAWTATGYKNTNVLQSCKSRTAIQNARTTSEKHRASASYDNS